MSEQPMTYGELVERAEAYNVAVRRVVDAYRPAVERIVEAFRALVPVVAELGAALVRSLAPFTDALVERWVIERRGITEVDIRRVDIGAGVVVLWNRRRVPIDWADLHEWSNL